MEKYKKSFIKLLKTPEFIIPIILVSIGGFGYLLSHSTINVDNLSADRYFQGTQLLAQKRLVAPILDKILGVMNYYPFLVDFLAVVCFIFVATMFCSLFDVISKNKIKTISYTIFSCFFISYPLMMEYFVYLPMGLTIALGFVFAAISLILLHEFTISKKASLFSIGTFLLWCSISLYESFAEVYIVGVFIILFLKVIFDNEKTKKSFFDGLKYLGSLIVAIVFNYIITNLIVNIFNIPEDVYADKTILWGEIGIKSILINIFSSIMVQYVIKATIFLPITFLFISVILSMYIGIIYSLKRKNSWIFFLILGMNFSLLLLSIIYGKAAPYRTCQQFPLFIAMTFMILTQIIVTSNIKKYKKNILIVVISLMIFYQVKDLYKYEYLNYIKYQKEKNDLIFIGHELEANYDTTNKPVFFIRKL